MDRSVVFLVIAVVFIACMFLAWYFSLKARYAGRISIIDKGLGPDDPMEEEKDKGISMLKSGIVIIGLSIGLWINGMLINLKVLHNSNAMTFVILGLCAGISLIIANFIEDRIDKDS